MANVIPYQPATLSMLNKEINWASDTIKVMLTTSTYAPDKVAHQYKSSVTNEVSGTGYTAGGVALASKTDVLASNVRTLSAANAVWTTSTITARYAVIYDDTGTAGTSALLGYLDFVTDKVSTAGTFTVTWSGTGIFTLTHNVS